MSDDLFKLSEYLVESHDSLKFGLATNCRCMCCHSFKLTNIDGKVMHEADGLEELVAMLPEPK